MSGHLIALEKQPGVRPVSVVETWRRIFSKIVLKVTVTEATISCRDDQLCVGIKAVIDGAIHGVRALWYKNSTTENWVFLLVDTKNSFNEINRVRMLWKVRHLCPFRIRFVFNFYRHWSSLVLQNRNGAASFLHSKEGVMQGDSLAMIVYGIGILPLIKNIKMEIPDVTQPWYAGNSGALGTFSRLETYYDSLTRQGPEWGYYPEPSKSVLIVRPENLKAGKNFRARHRFKVCAGAHYLGGYIGDNKSKRFCLRERTLVWEKKINMISATARKYRQESYAVVVRAIQSEWIFLQRVTWDTGDAFAGVEKMIQENFLPSLFFGKMETLSPIVGALSTMSVKKDGLVLLNPVTSAQEEYLSSQ